MSYRIGIAVMVATMLFLGIVAAQPRGQHGGMNQRPERVEKFRKMRLVELLKLGEEDAVRFFAKQGVHQEKVDGLMKSRNEALDQAEELAKAKPGNPDLQKKADEVIDMDQQIFAERQRFQKEMRAFLSPEQFVTFISFERNFGLKVRDALGRMRAGPGQMRREHD